MAKIEKMDDATTACEDLKFFEKRLTEVINYMGPTCTRWRIAAAIVIVLVGVTAMKWMTNPHIDQLTLWEFVYDNHFDFTLTILFCIALIAVFGVHRRVMAPTIIASRCREALAPFSLSCELNGKLIVKPARNVAP